jgi:hypothetical protein
LKALSISLANSGVSLGKGLTFEELNVSIANGHIEFNDVSTILSRLYIVVPVYNL